MKKINKSKNVKKLILIHVQDIFLMIPPYEKDQKIKRCKEIDSDEYPK